MSVNVHRRGGVHSIGARVSQSLYNHAIARNFSQYGLPLSPYGFPLQDDHACKVDCNVKKRR